MAGPPSGTVTFLFTDVEGSTRLWERHPETMKEALGEHDRIMRSSVAERDGHVFTTAGDAFSVAFGSVPDALEAAVSAQSNLRRLKVDGTPMRVRMAIHVGDADERDDDYFGPALNRCARLLAAGHGGQVLLSRVAAELADSFLREDVDLVDLGEHRLKDLSSAEHVYQLRHPELPHEFPPLRTVSARRQNLPLQLTSFVGRDRELAQLTALIADHRLVVVSGPGGIGKTRLAIQAATEAISEYRDGVWIVELGRVADAELVGDQFAGALGLRASGTTSLVESIIEYLSSRETLLVVDNCEHLVGEVVPLIESLLSACPALTIVATSRERFGIPGEVQYALDPLAGPPPESELDLDTILEWDAARLLWERAVEARPQLIADQATLEAIAAICRRLEGIPLALELAAARLRMLSPLELAERLDDRFALLTGGPTNTAGHHQTLRSAIAWSHDLLSPEEQVLYRRVAVFRGGFSLDEAVEISTDDPQRQSEVIDVLAGLIDKSLVGFDGARYEMLETIREHAAERLDAAGETNNLMRRHLAVFVRLAETAAPGLVSPDQLSLITRLDDSLDNIRAALGWGLTNEQESALRLSTALGAYWWRRGLYREGYDWLTACLDRAGDVSPQLRAEALKWAAVNAGLHWRAAEAEKHSKDAIALYEEIGDRRGYASAIVFASYSSHATDTHCRLLEALQILRECKDETGVVAALIALGMRTRRKGDLPQSRVWLEEAIALAETIDHLHGVQFAVLMLGVVAWNQGEHEEAMRCCQRSSELARRLGDQWGVAWSLVIQGHYHRRFGWWAQSSDAYREALEISERIGQQAGVIWSLEGLAGIALDEGEPSRAVRYLGLAERIARSIDFPDAARSDSHGRDLAAAREALDEPSFTAIWQKGAASRLSDL